jgi:predicted secreted hydrolase
MSQHRPSTARVATSPKGNWTGIKSVISLPADHYLHLGAPTEWWWHTGTLKAGKRTFGFEINAASFVGITAGFAFSQVMLTDVANKVHYQQTALQSINGKKWAESDPTQPWYVTMGDSTVAPTANTSWVTMNAPQSDPTKNMSVKAALFDAASGKIVTFDLNLSQEGPPFIVWGTGVTPVPTPPNLPTLKENNFYYSLTRLHAMGTVSIGGKSIPVTGLTWMDHEYGYFGTATKPVMWFLQDMQLENGVHISHYVSFPDDPPALDSRVKSVATIQFPDGTAYYDVNCFVTPVGKTWTNPTTNILFFLEFKVEIPSFNGTFHVSTPVPDQDFPFPNPFKPGTYISDTYEGVATVEGEFGGTRKLKGTAWNEQQGATPKPKTAKRR